MGVCCVLWLPMTDATIDGPMPIEQAIAAIYRAAAGATSWDEALSLLSDHLRILGAQMIGVDVATGAVTFSHASKRIPSEAEIAYVRTFHRVDPRVPLALPKPAGEWLYDQDLFPDEVAQTNTYYRDLLIPTGGRYTAGAKLCQHEGEITYIAFLSYADPAGFSAPQREFIGQIGYHLQEAAVIYKRARRLSTMAAAGEGLVRRMGHPTFVLSAGARIEIVNDRGRDFLTQGHGLASAAGVLTASHPVVQCKLSSTLAAMFRCSGGHGRRVLRIGSAAGNTRFVLSLTPFAPAETMFAFGVEPRVLAIVHAVDEKGSPDPMLWEAAFDLTLAEAQVAMHLTRGQSVKQIAARRGVSVPTVRTQVRALMDKTGSRRQVDLVARLLAVATLG